MSFARHSVMAWSPPVGQYPLQSQERTADYPARFGVVAKDLSVGYVLLATILAVNIAAASNGLDASMLLPFMVGSGLAVSVLLQYVFLFMHEAAHYNLHPKRSANDRYGNILVAYWFAWDVHNYRRMHWDHHLKHGQSDDPENSYFQPLTWCNLARTITGVMAATKVKNWAAYRSKGSGAKERAAGRRAVVVFSLYQTGMLSLFVLEGAWLPYILVWVIPLVCGFPLLAVVRQVCEHRKPNSGNQIFGQVPHGPYTRVFKPTLGALFLGGAGFRQHWYHHFNPHISYTRLDDFASEVRAALPALTKHVEESTYFKTFSGLLSDARCPISSSREVFQKDA